MEHLSEEQILELCDNLGKQNPKEINHIKTCDECHLKYNQALALHKSLKTLEYQRPSMRFAKNIVELLEKNKKLDRANILWTRIISGSILAAVGLAIVIMAFWFLSLFGNEENGQQILNQWNLIFLATAGGSWLLYFFDKWLGRSRQKQI